MKIMDENSTEQHGENLFIWYVCIGIVFATYTHFAENGPLADFGWRLSCCPLLTMVPYGAAWPLVIVCVLLARLGKYLETQVALPGYVNGYVRAVQSIGDAEAGEPLEDGEIDESESRESDESDTSSS